MTPSPRIIAFIKFYEQCRLHAYKPTPDDVWTIGWGATGPDIGPDTVWTQAQADARFFADINRFAAGVNRELDDEPTTQGQFDAMVSLAFNIGLGNFGASTLLHLHLAGNRREAVEQFGRWVKQKGVTLPGLVKRRAAEAEIYREG